MQNLFIIIMSATMSNINAVIIHMIYEAVFIINPTTVFTL